MVHTFSRCNKLIDLDLTNFEINKENRYNYMFSLCYNDLKEKIKIQNKNFENDAFQDGDFKSRFYLDDFIFDNIYNIYRDNNKDN